jgi:uncharacterized GH25 family protein
MRESKLSLMVHGHEIWLEKTGAENGNMELSLVFGHNMRQDGVGDVKRLSPLVYLPDGNKLDVSLTPGQDRHTMKFNASRDGFYTAFVDMGTTIWSQTNEGYNEGPKFKFKDVIYAGAYHQMAKDDCCRRKSRSVPWRCPARNTRDCAQRALRASGRIH